MRKGYGGGDEEEKVNAGVEPKKNGVTERSGKLSRPLQRSPRIWMVGLKG
jgi:hypothetical protein